MRDGKTMQIFFDISGGKVLFYSEAKISGEKLAVVTWKVSMQTVG